MEQKDTDEKQKYTEPIYKKWFRTKDKAGFISITPWFDNEQDITKLIIDIGEANPQTKQLLSSTNFFVDGFKLGSFLHSVSHGTGTMNFPIKKKKINDEWQNDPDNRTNESISFYGGSGNVARVFRIHHWETKDGHDSSSFVFKTGHFKGNTSSTGAIIPIMSEPISANLIKMTRPEIAELSYIIDIELNRR
jgi:hypothetical protein